MPNTYNLTNLPAYVKAIAGDGCTAAAKWSGAFEPPAIGDTVVVKVNGIGPAKVRAYFVQHGWLGVHVDPVSPPEWYIKQNGLGAPCHVFGAEISLPEALTVEGVTYGSAEDAAAAAAGYPPVRS